MTQVFFNVATDSLFRPPAKAVKGKKALTTSLAIPQQPRDTVCTTVIHSESDEICVALV